MVLRCLTFELSGSRRWDARPGLWKMRHATDRAWWPAVGAPLERWVTQHVAHAAYGFTAGTSSVSKPAGRTISSISMSGL